ncbi:MAG TPA: sirohydrochlorin chelatase [Waterburya sp.]|jgi:sirohydrochlorin ferrochelatase
MDKLAEQVCTRLATQNAYRKQGIDASRELGVRNRDLSFPVNGCFPRPEIEFNTGSTMVVSRTGYPLVGTATLELADAPLHEQIQHFARVALGSGYNHLQVLPLFLLPGVHVGEDIPAEVALAQQGLGDAVVINLRSHIGTHSGLGKWLARQWAKVDVEGKVLLSHGSRRAGGNAPVEAIAQSLGAVVAYWLVPPTLEVQIQGLVEAGYQRIGILPYFLFAGGITDAIAQQVDRLRVQFPNVELSLGEPMGGSSELVDLIVDLIE